MQAIRIMRWEDAQLWAHPIRLTVFVNEQRVPEDLEIDQDDSLAWHAVVFENQQAIATGRLLPSGKIGRLAVLRPYRGQGIGTAIMKELIGFGRQNQITQFYLHAQTAAQGFYERLGFKATGSNFYEAGIEHIRMALNEN